MKRIVLIVILATHGVFAQHTSHNHNPLSYAPIGVMGDHAHPQGEFMFSYRFMFMNMDGNLDENSSMSESNVLADYMVAPRSMDMMMHMVGVYVCSHEQNYLNGYVAL